MSSVLGRLANFLLVPLYTALLPNPAKYGIVSEWYSYVALLNIVYLYGMETTYFRYAGRKNPGEHRVFAQILGMLFLSGIFFSGLLWFFSEPLAAAVRYPHQAQYLRWFSLIVLADTLAAIPLARLRLLQNSWRFSLVKLKHIALYILFNLFFLLLCPLVIQGDDSTLLYRVISAIYTPQWDIAYIFLSNLLASFALLFFLRKEIFSYRFFFRRALATKLLGYALPLMIMAFGLVAVDALPRILYKHLLWGSRSAEQLLTDLGIYSACAKLGVLMLLLTQAFRYAADPIMLSEQEDSTTKGKIAAWLTSFVGIGSFVFVAISLQPTILSFLFLRNPLYREGVDVVPVLLLGYLFFGVYQYLSIWFKRTQRTVFGIYFSSFAIVLVLLSNGWLVPIAGYRGMAWSVLAVYFSMACLCYVVGRCYYPVDYSIRDTLGVLALSALLVLGWYFFVRDSLLHDHAEWAIATALTLCYGWWVFWRERKKYQAVSSTRTIR